MLCLCCLNSLPGGSPARAQVELTNLFKQLDLDGSGYVCIEEFLEAFHNSADFGRLREKTTIQKMASAHLGFHANCTFVVCWFCGVPL